jgi:predicted NUDIX family phosphoesterase
MTSNNEIEKVLCFSAKVLKELGEPDLYSTDIQKYFFGILKQENICFVDRDKAEVDPSFKQIIPYHVLKSDDRYFVYRRGKKGGENRLHARLSIGVGGHINDTDIPDYNDIGNYSDSAIAIYGVGAGREIKEEVEMPEHYNWWTIGVLYDPSNDVGKVHFGFVHLLDVGSCGVKVLDESLDFVGWYTKEMLLEYYDELENWSQIVVDNLLEV